jgi:hypothetical protein
VSNSTLASIAFNSELYVGLGNGGLFYSYDGINWTNSPSGTALINNASKQIGKVAWNGRIWVAVGFGTSAIIYSSNGINWTGVNTSAILSNGAFDLAWNGTIWVATGLNSSNQYSVATSLNGVNWTQGTI